MKVHRLTETNVARWEELGAEIEAFSKQCDAIMSKPPEEITDIDLEQIKEFTEKQIELHTRRVGLLI